jgi:serine/threonine-protein kinase
MDAPAALELVILRCLEKDRDKRYGNVARLAVALRDFASSRGKQSVDAILRTLEASGQPVMSAAPAAVPASVTIGQKTIEPLGKTQIPMQGGKGKTIAIAGGVAALVVIGVIGLRAAQSNAPSGAAVLATSAVPATLPAVAAAAPSASAAAPATAESAPAAASAATEPSAAASVAAPSPPAAAGTPKKALPAAIPAARPAAPAKPKANCDPNYYLDAQGEKHFKPECFH